MNRIPEALYRPESINYSMGEVIHGQGPDRYQEFQTFNGEWLFSFKIPPFQRPIVWTDEQCIRFIESAWLNFYLGTYTINIVNWTGGMIHETDHYLIDGRQRLTAIKRYISGEFTVFGYLYGELTDREHRRFEDVPFTQCRVSIQDVKLLKDLYNMLNFGGTPHTIGQVAL